MQPRRKTLSAITMQNLWKKTQTEEDDDACREAEEVQISSNKTPPEVKLMDFFVLIHRKEKVRCCLFFAIHLAIPSALSFLLLLIFTHARIWPNISAPTLRLPFPNKGIPTRTKSSPVTDAVQ